MEDDQKKLKNGRQPENVFFLNVRQQKYKNI
jgi:hypothetical protein